MSCIVACLGMVKAKAFDFLDNEAGQERLSVPPALRRGALLAPI